MKNFILVVAFFLLNPFQVSSQIVVLQPDGTTGQDAIVFEGRNNVNLGWQESLTSYVWTFQGGVSRKRFLLNFDFSSIPSAAIIDSVFLDLYFNPTDPYEGFDYHTGFNAITIQKVTSAWNESTVTWQTQPTTDPSVSLNLPASVSSTQNYLGIDVTKFFQDANTSPAANHGIMFRMADESNYYKSVLFASSNHQNESLRPTLTVHYHIDSVVCQTIKPSRESSNDAKVFSVRPNDNFNSFESLTAYTWTYGGQLALKRFYLGFDLSVIPANAILDTAILNLYYNPTDNYESFDYHTGNTAFYVMRTNSAWDAGSITWNNQPKVASSSFMFVTSSNSPTRDYAIPVTKLVDQMLQQPVNERGFRINLFDETNPYNALLFASSEHPNNALRPSLTVCWRDMREPTGQSVAEGVEPGVYPNPSADGIFNISGLSNQQPVQINIYDITGRLVPYDWNEAGILKLMSKGQFILQIQSVSGEIKTFKIIAL